jgi:hypothetical protein
MFMESLVPGFDPLRANIADKLRNKEDIPADLPGMYKRACGWEPAARPELAPRGLGAVLVAPVTPAASQEIKAQAGSQEEWDAFLEHKAYLAAMICRNCKERGHSQRRCPKPPQGASAGPSSPPGSRTTRSSTPRDAGAGSTSPQRSRAVSSRTASTPDTRHDPAASTSQLRARVLALLASTEEADPADRVLMAYSSAAGAPDAEVPEGYTFGLDDHADLLHQDGSDAGFTGHALALMVRELRDADDAEDELRDAGDEDDGDYYCHAPRAVGAPRPTVLGGELQASTAGSESGAGVLGTEDEARDTETETSGPPDEDRGIEEHTGTGSGGDGQDNRVLTLSPPVADTVTHEAEPPPAGGWTDWNWDTAVQWEPRQQTLAFEAGVHTDAAALELVAFEAGVHADGEARGIAGVRPPADLAAFEMVALAAGVRAALAAGAHMHVDVPLTAPGIDTADGEARGFLAAMDDVGPDDVVLIEHVGMPTDDEARGPANFFPTVAHMHYAAHSVRPDCLAGMEFLTTRVAEPPPPSRTQQGCVGE